QFDYYVVKSAVADGKILWEYRYDDPAHGDDRPTSITVDSGGNAVLTGSSANGATNDIYTVKLSGIDGTRLWERRYHPPQSRGNIGIAVLTDAQNDVIVGGASDLALYFARYSGTDGSIIWEQREEPKPGQVSIDLAGMVLDQDGNILAAGALYQNFSYDL